MRRDTNKAQLSWATQTDMLSGFIGRLNHKGGGGMALHATCIKPRGPPAVYKPFYC